MPLFTILSLFPEALEAYLSVGVVGQGRARGAFAAQVVDFRDFARDRHRTVDDRPFGGGPGMVLKPEPLVEAVEWVEDRFGPHRRIALCPSGRTFDQALAREFADELESDGRFLLLCGRYEGFDERIYEELRLERLSVGNFVLAGGELASLCVVESIVRLLPGVLGDERSALEDSFDANLADVQASSGSHLGPLDHPHYTRPRTFRGRDVPEVLFSGDHARIRDWRADRAAERTSERRPDLLPPTDHPPSDPVPGGTAESGDPETQGR